MRTTRFLIAVAALVAVSTVDAGAQSFLKKLGEKAKNAAERVIIARGQIVTLWDIGIFHDIDIQAVAEKLTRLDVSNNTALERLACNINLFNAAGLDALFNTLHSNHVSQKTIYIQNNPGTNGCDKTIATAKGWTFVN